MEVLQLPVRDSDSDFPTNSCVSFTVGEWPKIPANPKRCHRFLRFSSKVSGRQGHVEPYIGGVYRIAKEYFGVRVRWWHELYDMGEDSRKCWGYYDWAEVHEADEELKQLETEEQEVNREGTERDNMKVEQGP
jgi:hypothetical protein